MPSSMATIPRQQTMKTSLLPMKHPSASRRPLASLLDDPRHPGVINAIIGASPTEKDARDLLLDAGFDLGDLRRGKCAELHTRATHYFASWAECLAWAQTNHPERFGDGEGVRL